jgi:hypothetical protein
MLWLNPGRSTLPKTDVFQRKPAGSIPVTAFIAALLVAAASAGWYFYSRGGQPGPQGPVLTPEAKAYVRHLQLSDVEMKAHESYLRQQVVEIVGKITNGGDRVLKLVEIHCIFYDPYSQVVLRQRVAIIGQRTGELRPGETKNFRLPFDDLPESWNQSLPQLVIARIIFG